jgi:hypothetical protein
MISFNYLFATIIVISTFMLIESQKLEDIKATGPWVSPCWEYARCRREAIIEEHRCSWDQELGIYGGSEMEKHCALVDDFYELITLIQNRHQAFIECIRSKDHPILWTKTTQCPQSNSLNAKRASVDCWKTVQAKRRTCNELGRCCPVSVPCFRDIRKTNFTQAINDKMAEIRLKSAECRNLINSTSTRTNQLLELIEESRHQKVFYFGDDVKSEDKGAKLEQPSSTAKTTTTIKPARNSSTSGGSKKASKLDEKKTASQSATPKKKASVEVVPSTPKKANITVSGTTHENVSDSVIMHESSGTGSDEMQPETGSNN